MQSLKDIFISLNSHLFLNIKSSSQTSFSSQMLPSFWYLEIIYLKRKYTKEDLEF